MKVLEKTKVHNFPSRKHQRVILYKRAKNKNISFLRRIQTGGDEETGGAHARREESAHCHRFPVPRQTGIPLQGTVYYIDRDRRTPFQFNFLLYSFVVNIISCFPLVVVIFV